MASHSLLPRAQEAARYLPTQANQASSFPRLNGIQKVRGSNPLGSIKRISVLGATKNPRLMFGVLSSGCDRSLSAAYLRACLSGTMPHAATNFRNVGQCTLCKTGWRSALTWLEAC
jgi:hypothetical protein